MLPVSSSRSLSSVVDSWPMKGVALLSGGRFPMEVSHLWITEFSLRQIPVLVVDCAIRLDLFRLVDEALRRDVNPDTILSAIMVQRVFTPYHIVEAITRADRQRRPLTILLAPLKQFFDGDVAEEEGLFLLRRMIVRLRSANCPFLIVEKDHYSHPSFRIIFPELEAIAASIWKVSDGNPEHISVSDHSRMRALWDAQLLPIHGNSKR